MPQQINQNYAKNVFGKIMKKSEQDPDMISKMASVGALYSVTNKEAEQWEAKQVGSQTRTSI